MKYPMLETERLFLRRPTPTDHDLALRQLGNPSLCATAPLSGRAAWTQLALFLGHWALHGHGLFAAVPHGSDRAIGLVGPWQPTGWPEPELGWMVWGDDACGSLTQEALATTRHFAQTVLGWTDPVSYASTDTATAWATAAGAVPDPFAPTADGHTATVLRHPPRRSRIRRAA